VAPGRPIVVAGRLPDERCPEEAVVDEELAEHRHLGWAPLPRRAFTLEQFGPAGEGRAVTPQGAVFELQVVGIVRRSVRDLVPVVTDQDNPFATTA
jgi:hypothetical protein